MYFNAYSPMHVISIPDYVKAICNCPDIFKAFFLISNIDMKIYIHMYIYMHLYTFKYFSHL